MLLLAALLLAPALAAQDAGIEQAELDNGLKLIVVPMEGAATTACRLVYNVGAANERPGITGMSHYLEHMMFKGTDRLLTKDWEDEKPELEKLDRIAAELAVVRANIQAAQEAGRQPDSSLADKEKDLTADFNEQEKVCDKYIDGKQINSYYTAAGGANVNANTSSDRTLYMVDLPANKIELFFWIESERMRRCVFREFYKEKKVVQEERRMGMANPGRRFGEQMRTMLYEATPYRIPTLGWPSDVEAITRKQLFDYYNTYYQPNNAALILAGDITLSRALELAKKYFGPIARAPMPPRVYTTNAHPAGERQLVSELETDPSIQIAYSGVAQHHADADALGVLGDWLGSDTGPLYKKLVTEEKLALRVGAGSSESRYGGMFSIYVRPINPADGEKIIARVDEILADVLADKTGFAVTQDRITGYAAGWESGLIQSMGAPTRAATSLAEWVFSPCGIELIGKRVARSRKLLPADVTEAGKRWLAKENRVVGRILPPVKAGAAASQDSGTPAIAELTRHIADEKDPKKRAELERILEGLRAKREESPKETPKGK